MDMKEDNDLLLQQLFSEAAQQKIEDNGFTERVMHRLPLRVNWFTRLWTAFCILVALLLFTLFHGWELLAVQLEVLIRTLPTEPLSGRLVMVVTVFIGLLIAGASEFISSETARR
jgi:hypothetical protein